MKTLAKRSFVHYLCGAIWILKFTRIFKHPFMRCMFPFKKVIHIATPLKRVLTYPAQNQSQGYQKTVECSMLWWRKIQKISRRLKVWSGILERVTYAIAIPVPDRDTETLLRFLFESKSKEISAVPKLSPDRTFYV